MKDKQIEEIIATMKQPGADGEFAFDEEEGDGDGDEDDDSKKNKGLGVIPEKWNVPQGAWGTQYLTLYDVGPIGIDEAVTRSAAIMPNLKNAGRKLDCHVGGLTVTLERA